MASSSSSHLPASVFNPRRHVGVHAERISDVVRPQKLDRLPSHLRLPSTWCSPHAWSSSLCPRSLLHRPSACVRTLLLLRRALALPRSRSAALSHQVPAHRPAPRSHRVVAIERIQEIGSVFATSLPWCSFVHTVSFAASPRAGSCRAPHSMRTKHATRIALPHSCVPSQNRARAAQRRTEGGVVLMCSSHILPCLTPHRSSTASLGTIAGTRPHAQSPPERPLSSPEQRRPPAVGLPTISGTAVACARRTSEPLKSCIRASLLLSRLHCAPDKHCSRRSSVLSGSSPLSF
ncbi:hypothetical protein BV20DRAFT_699056 [Pilatotrama ljubarskyi]|nr:hypothetical protein BV20DRAFT_699056 [Pilatotrama ljubarskyi]